MSTRYRGRFAPTPSGPLHFGSLVAALGGYLEARRHNGQWWLRIDDLDTARVQPGATDAILRCLARYGFEWDGPVVYQSRRLEVYHAALHRLRQRHWIYPCGCSRTDIAGTAAQGLEGPVYAGTCRAGMPPHRRARAWRLRCDNALVKLEDPVQGSQRMDIASTLGDFVLYRADGVFAFHLASAIDDTTMGMTDIVRGVDLLPSSLRQIHLLGLLGARPPRYVHLPVACDSAGDKLSKQTHAPALDETHPQRELLRALTFLGQAPPVELAGASLTTLWEWARLHWRLDNVARAVQRPVAGNSFASSARSGGST